MSSISKISSNQSLTRLFTALLRPLSTATATAAASTVETQTLKFERIADELLDLTKLERYDYSILFRHKMGLNRYGLAVSAPSGPAVAAGGKAAATVEKTAFDIKLEKFDKEVRSFTDLRLKEAKDLWRKCLPW